jgi:hypothetical protein
LSVSLILVRLLLSLFGKVACRKNAWQRLNSDERVNVKGDFLVRYGACIEFLPEGARLPVSRVMAAQANVDPGNT